MISLVIWFYGISNLGGYLVRNLVYTYILSWWFIDNFFIKEIELIFFFFAQR